MHLGDKNETIAMETQEKPAASHFEDVGDVKTDLKGVYIADHSRSHKKSKEERVLITKCDMIIVPLGALLYFVAYVVRGCLPWNDGKIWLTSV